MTWNYFKDNFDRLIENSQGVFLLPRVIEVQLYIVFTDYNIVL